MASDFPKTFADTLKQAWHGYPAAVVLATLYPTLFVLSQNWYALSTNQALWLVAVAPLAGIAIYAVVAALLAAASWLARSIGRPLPTEVRPVVFGIVCGAIVSLLLYQTLKHALDSHALRTLAYILIGALFVVVFLRGATRHLNAFLALLCVVASASWAIGTTDTSQSWIEKVTQDFETAKFKRKPNVYLFIYDGYTTPETYRTIFDFDNAPHEAALEDRGFKVLHTFSNYRMTLQTIVGLFLGKHHYYSTDTGFNDTQKGRPLITGVVHNPVLATFKANGYRIQHIHGLDYFANEPGVLDYLFPEQPPSSALRVFNTPLLKRKRRISLDTQTETLYARIQPPPRGERAPWFTFSHVNLPSHADLARNWRELGDFEQRFREKTAAANTHMLALIDRIRAADPGAIVIVFGDHGPHRYNGMANETDLNAALSEAGTNRETVARDLFAVTLAVGSGGVCDRDVYPGLTPVNLMRSLIACLADDPGLLDGRVEDITLFRRKGKELVLMAKDGLALPTWENFTPPTLPH